MSKYPSVGELRHRVFFQRAISTDDGYGGKVQTWINCGEAWAKIAPLSGREYFDAHQIQAEVTHRITMRYRTDLTTDLRLSAGGRVFEIESILDLNEGHQFLEVLCTEAK